jgi:hypothetical protein
MSRPLLPSEPSELLRRLAEEPVPSAPEDASPARRERLVRAMRDAVERSAEQVERRRRFQRIAWAIAAAAGFVLITGVLVRERWHATHPTTIAGIDAVSGTVVLTQEGARRVVSAAERTLHDGDSLQTAAGAHARVATSKSSVNLSESTELRLSRPSAAEERISLRRGRVDVSVDKGIEAKRAVVVETPDAEVVVRGTVFDVRVEPEKNATSTHVHVTRGSVWVLSQGVQVALLSAGQSWSSTGGVSTPAATPAPAPSTVAVPAPEAEAAVVPAPAPAVASKVGSAASHKPGTLAEENRLFASAVEARNRGDASRAAELFGELLGSYPKSALRESAQVERMRALARAGQASRAASEARQYLAEHGDGFARDEARELALGSKK